ncbi:hypothetical protein FHS00_000089 [Limimaricola variabilis]|jgi:hypothetical protein|uniref:PH domain-containing protein n=1 Tax=Limimaricola variabilis TaxID=1492771 RepID=A0ABR6HJ00_9RHOB|nr:hypothetical protein [Limimaricola variabilis]MBB3710536.1 hypothetical protein [Limimaricola variabilis]
MTAAVPTRSIRAPFILGGQRRWQRIAMLTAFAAWAFALGVTAAVGAIWLSPMGLSLDGELWLRLVVAVTLGGGLVCYGALGRREEMHFDAERRMVRAVLRRPSGRVEPVARWRFEDFSGVEIRSRAEARSMALRAELHLVGRGLSVRVAEGDLDAMTALARRIEAELGLSAPRGGRLFRRGA